LKETKTPSRSGKEPPLDHQDKQESIWTVYIVECRDGTFYTGITTDLARRLDQHNRGRASRYTRSRLPVTLVHEESMRTRSEALIREEEIKSLSRQEKEALIQPP